MDLRPRLPPRLTLELLLIRHAEPIRIDAKPKGFRQRSIQAVEAVIAGHPGQRVAVITHGGIINLYLGHLIGASRPFFFVPDHTSITTVRAARSGERTVVNVNLAVHLQSKRLKAT